MPDLHKNDALSKKKFLGHEQTFSSVLRDILKSEKIDVQEDVYGDGAAIQKLETRLATLLGKPSARFFPSGTMAQQSALRIHCDNKNMKRVAFHPLSHVERDEMNALKELHQINSVLFGDDDNVFTVEDLKSKPIDYAAILIELPNRRLGGKVNSWNELLELHAFAQKNNISLHLDGARLWEIQPYFNKSFAEICALFDSVYVSFYKALGGISGAMLLGTSEFIETAKIWQKRMGGTLFTHHPIVLSAALGLTKYQPKMACYWANAKKLAVKLNKIEGISTVPELPTSALFHIHINRDIKAATVALDTVYQQTGVVITKRLNETKAGCMFEVSLFSNFDALATHDIDNALKVLAEQLNEKKENANTNTKGTIKGE